MPTVWTKGSASFSRCRTYRYVLRRHWDFGHGTVAFIGLNPSTATATEDDPTMRRCIRFAQDWGYAQFIMLNLFAFRATDPRDLVRADEPLGPRNRRTIARIARESDCVVAAWGAHPMAATHARTIVTHGGPLQCLGTTRNGSPRHPLYVAAATRRVRFQMDPLSPA